MTSSDLAVDLAAMGPYGFVALARKVAAFADAQMALVPAASAVAGHDDVAELAELAELAVENERAAEPLHADAAVGASYAACDRSVASAAVSFAAAASSISAVLVTASSAA